MMHATSGKPRSPARTLILTGVLALAAVPLALGIGVLYWRVRISIALRDWERDCAATPYPQVAYDQGPGARFVFGAGCRALPQMVSALNTTDNREFQERLMANIVSILIRQVPKGQEFRMLDEWSSRWNFRADGTELEQRYKTEDFNAWWEKHRSRCHQWWCFWTDACGTLSWDDR